MNYGGRFSQMLAQTVAGGINKQMSAAQQQAFARHSGSHVGLQIGGAPCAVFRIGDDGYLTAASPLVAPDALLRWNSARAEMEISGSAPLLETLSAFRRELDVAALFANLFGPVLAPKLFYAWQCAAAVGGRWIDERAVTPDEMAVYEAGVGDLQKRVAKLKTRVVDARRRRV